MSGVDEPLSTMAFCWRLERRDGLTIGLTSHDRNLRFRGLIYHSQPGLVPSAIEQGEGGAPVDLRGALTSDLLTARDIRAGRWVGAELTLFFVDWEEPERDPRLLMAGTLGAAEIKDQAFSVALNGLSRRLDQGVVEMTSPECRASLGDERCRVSLHGRRLIVSIAAVPSETELVTVEQLGPEGRFSWGQLTWLDGANAGQTQMVVAASAGQLTLRESPGEPARAGDRCELTEGCDGRLETCRTRFHNVSNFRGEPHLSGNDLLSRYAS